MQQLYARIALRNSSRICNSGNRSSNADAFVHPMQMHLNGRSGVPVDGLAIASEINKLTIITELLRGPPVQTVDCAWHTS